MNWRTIDPLPSARYNHAVAAYRNWIYVAGGATNYAMSVVPLSVLKSRIDPEGSGGSNSPWVSCAPDMLVGKIGCSLLVNQGNLIIVGGRGADVTAADNNPAQDIHVGKIDSDGNIPRWISTAGALPSPMLDMGVLIKDDWLYMIGGNRADLSLNYDGQLVNFTAGQIIHGHTSAASAVIYSDTDGGSSGTLVLSNFAGDFVNNEEIVVEHATATSVMSPAAATSFYLDYDTQTVNFTVGQVLTGGSSGATGTISADTDAGTTGTLTLTGVSGIFQAGETITSAVAGSGKVAAGTVKYKTLAYDTQTYNFAAAQIIWGLTSGATATIMSDTDAGTTGVLKVKLITGTFSAGEILAVDHATVDLAATQTTTALTSIYRARLFPDGGIGPFVLLSAVSPVSGDLRGACEVVGNNVFISNTTSLYVAHIGPDGIGSWTTYVPGFSKISHSLMRVLRDHLIAIGGYNGSTTVTTSYSATINSSGEANPVTWHQTQTMPLTKRRFGLTKIGSRIFVVGGVDVNNAVRTEVYTANLDPAGTIGGV